MHEPTDDLDTLTWLLQTEGCPYCGAPIHSADPACAACQFGIGQGHLAKIPVTQPICMHWHWRS